MAFRLRRGSMMTVTVVTPDGEPVATIANHYFRRGPIKPLGWNGRDSRAPSCRTAVQAPDPPAPPDDHAAEHDPGRHDATCDHDQARGSPRVLARSRRAAGVRHDLVRRLGDGAAAPLRRAEAGRPRPADADGREHPLVRRRARRDLPARRLPAVAPRGRSRRKHLAADERRPRRDPLPDARAEGRPSARGQAVRASGRERRQERPVAPARQVRAKNRRGRCASARRRSRGGTSSSSPPNGRSQAALVVVSK